MAHGYKSKDSWSEKAGRKAYVPEAHILSDLLMIAPFLIMPSVWPVPESKSVDFLT
jgi:hypothetical protein